MTARDLADRLGARPAGPGRWVARSPLRTDRTPSLGIREGDGGRVLLHDFGGGETAEILAAAGLTWADVCGTPATSADRARLRAQREARQQAEVAARRQAEAVGATAEATMAHAARLAAALAAATWAGAPGDADALAQQYHAALGASREIEAAHAA